jgi:hypothetical protein
MNLHGGSFNLQPAAGPADPDRRSVTTTSRESPRLWRRLLTALGGALKRGVLGKSSHDYMKQFNGGDEYWDKIIAAQNSIQDIARRPSEPEYEPVHGWTKRQLDDYLANNPGYRSTYETELQKH